MTSARTPSTYRVIQLGAPRHPHGFQTNEVVTDFDGLVTHHPRANQHAQMVDGRIISGEPGRIHAISEVRSRKSRWRDREGRKGWGRTRFC